MLLIAASPAGLIWEMWVWEAWAGNNGADPALKEIGGVQRSGLSRKVSLLTGAETRPLWIDGRTQRGYVDRELARCSQCPAVVPSAELLDVDGRGATCRSCRGEDVDGGASAGADEQGGFAGMRETAHPGDFAIRLLEDVVTPRKLWYAGIVDRLDADAASLDGPLRRSLVEQARFDEACGLGDFAALCSKYEEGRREVVERSQTLDGITRPHSEYVAALANLEAFEAALRLMPAPVVVTPAGLLILGVKGLRDLRGGVDELVFSGEVALGAWTRFCLILRAQLAPAEPTQAAGVLARLLAGVIPEPGQERLPGMPSERPASQ